MRVTVGSDHFPYCLPQCLGCGRTGAATIRVCRRHHVLPPLKLQYTLNYLNETYHPPVRLLDHRRSSPRPPQILQSDRCPLLLVVEAYSLERFYRGALLVHLDQQHSRMRPLTSPHLPSPVLRPSRPLYREAPVPGLLQPQLPPKMTNAPSGGEWLQRLGIPVHKEVHSRVGVLHQVVGWKGLHLSPHRQASRRRRHKLTHKFSHSINGHRLSHPRFSPSCLLLRSQRQLYRVSHDKRLYLNHRHLDRHQLWPRHLMRIKGPLQYLLPLLPRQDHEKIELRERKVARHECLCS